MCVFWFLLLTIGKKTGVQSFASRRDHAGVGTSGEQNSRSLPYIGVGFCMCMRMLLACEQGQGR